MYFFRFQKLPDLSQLFSVGQLLRWVIIELGEDGKGRKRVDLALTHVNSNLDSSDLTADMVGIWKPLML